MALWLEAKEVRELDLKTLWGVWRLEEVRGVQEEVRVPLGMQRGEVGAVAAVAQGDWAVARWVKQALLVVG